MLANSSGSAGGLVRLVQLTPDTIMVDASVYGLDVGEYPVNLHEYGDVSLGVGSLGPVTTVAAIASVSVCSEEGSVVGEVGGRLMEWIGHGMSVGSCYGIVARSSGVFNNPKRICACDGRTLWEEAALLQ